MKSIFRIIALLLVGLAVAGCMPRTLQPEASSNSLVPPTPPQVEPPTLSLAACDGGLTLQGYAHELSLPGGVGFNAQNQPSPQPPVLTLDTPLAPVFTPSAEVVGSQVTITLGDDEVFSGTLDELEGFSPQANGDYQVDISIAWGGEELSGNSSYRMVLHYQMPVAFVLDATSVPMGDPLVLRVLYAGPDDTVTATTDLNFTPRFFDYNGQKIALLPIHPGTKPGNYTVELACGGSSAQLAVKVSETKFEVQHIQVEESVASNTINSSKANNEYAEKIAPVREIADPVKYWSGVFEVPIENYNRISSEYGFTRYYNDNPNPDRHNGVDFACPTGTPVQAPGAGRVVFAQFLQLTGNTVVIEHGFGLKSWYYHMDKILTEEGQMVQTGDLIGEVGSTGFATGPHLHFGMSVNNVFINPWTMFESHLLD